MAEFIIVIALLVILFVLVQKYFLSAPARTRHEYRHKAHLLSEEEVAFYNALKAAVADQGVVFAKVSMSSLIVPRDVASKKHRFAAHQKIARSHFDFVISDPRTFEPRVVVELDNGLPLDPAKRERQKLLIHVCNSANLPLIGASVKHSYQVAKLRRLLASHIDLIEAEQEVRFCKQCQSPMMLRTVSHGVHKGRRFFTCARQPNCHYTENYNVVFESDERQDQERSKLE